MNDHATKIDDFEETVKRHLDSLNAGARGDDYKTGYYAGRADEYAAQNAVDSEAAYREAQSRFGG